MDIRIQGMGIVSAIGNNASEVCASLKQRKGGIGPMRHLPSVHKQLPVGEVKLSDDQMKRLLGLPSDTLVSRTTLMGALSLREAVRDAGIPLSGKRCVVISGTTVGGMDLTEQYFERMKTDEGLLPILLRHDCGSSTRHIADLSGLQDAEAVTISTACSSALNAIILGCEMLKRHEADIVFAGGAEGLSRFHLNGFNSLLILDHEPCRPYDKNRAGLNLGEGAAFVALLRVGDATKGPYVAGYGNRCDAFHQTASSENGQGAFLAMTDALEMAHLKAEDIQYVNTHGTGTPNNDMSESAALRRVFGNHLPLLSSTKGFTGHTTSASGSIETIISALAMREGFVPCNLGWQQADENCVEPSLGMDGVRLDNVICNAFGFGGNDSSLVLSQSAPPKSASGNPAAQAKEDIPVVVASESVIDDVQMLSEAKELIPPVQARRMGKLMKASMMTSLRALSQAGIECPDAIIAATQYGMMETTEQFLEDISAQGEQLLKPTLFMQSTHNTLASAIAIRLRCHGYNITYSQGERSMEWAMRDAERLIKTGKAETVLVGCHDESTPLIREWMKRLGRPVPKEVYSRSVVLKKG